MNNIKISIIVPVYNTGVFLKNCVDSILSQTLKEWELLLIDDGSTDESGSICDEYSRLDGRITVIHKKNQGVSVARNTGIGMAKGEYIGFVDSDDTIEPEMYEKLYNEAIGNNAEIAMCDAVTVYKDNREEKDTIAQLSDTVTIEKSCWSPSLVKEMAGSSCRCIYSNALIQRHSSQFPVALKFSEDRVFNIYMMGYANRVRYIKEAFYKRLIREDSCVHRFHSDYFETAKYACDCTQKAIEQAWNNDEKYKTAYLEQFITASIASINNYFYKSCPWTLKQKYKAVKNLCDDQKLREAISKSGYGGIRGKWIKDRRVLLLCIFAFILNKKYGR